MDVWSAAQSKAAARIFAKALQPARIDPPTQTAASSPARSAFVVVSVARPTSESSQAGVGTESTDCKANGTDEEDEGDLSSIYTESYESSDGLQVERESGKILLFSKQAHACSSKSARRCQYAKL
ncbi:unnamed protein product [Acanthoscelides obtectus]|uniref:Uncharacterized protein n=1 Tax=Acanthoscelides obtectus TaxID=200917 RepID=A0A9P0KHT2_ACAOB|nr:unnamed protein product [Acanthoscelides obtectus]CAK1656436.1 hypothetical protein AOBTE_LOCUS19709 [Acanthoscelides obtectus]